MKFIYRTFLFFFLLTSLLHSQSGKNRLSLAARPATPPIPFDVRIWTETIDGYEAKGLRLISDEIKMGGPVSDRWKLVKSTTASAEAKAPFAKEIECTFSVYPSKDFFPKFNKRELYDFAKKILLQANRNKLVSVDFTEIEEKEIKFSDKDLENLDAIFIKDKVKLKHYFRRPCYTLEHTTNIYNENKKLVGQLKEINYFINLKNYRLWVSLSAPIDKFDFNHKSIDGFLGLLYWANDPSLKRFSEGKDVNWSEFGF